jgi:exodeoxyribonuclease-3
METRRGLPGDPDDTHSRYMEASIGGMTVGCLYLPNGNPAPGPKFDYKLRWFDRLAAHAKTLLATGKPIVLAGDYNVMPSDLDVYARERWVDDALFREVREAYRLLVAQGWTDALVELHPGKRIYTFWKYFRNAFARDAGLRIDHFLLSPPLAERLIFAGVDRDVRGREHASDHAPAWINSCCGEFPRPKICFISEGEFSLTEMTMDEQQAYSSNIAPRQWGEAWEPAYRRPRANSPAACCVGGTSSKSRRQDCGITRREIRRCVHGRHGGRSAGLVA